MLEPVFPVNEDDRLATLRRLSLLDTPAEDRFDRITRLARHLFDVPIVLITLVDSNRQWLKSSIGLNIRETSRSVSFCGHAINEDDFLIVNDTLLDLRFADNPLVTGEPHIRFYAGRVVRAANGAALGTLCLIDRVPRYLDPVQLCLLDDLGQLAEKEINQPDLKVLTERLMQSQRELLAGVSRLRKARQLEHSRNRNLELISSGYPLNEVLASIAYEIEQLCPDIGVYIELGHPGKLNPSRHWGRRNKLPKGEHKICHTREIIGSNGDSLGTINVLKPGFDTLDGQEFYLVESSAVVASIAIERDQSERLIWKKANYDPLTKLPNRNLLYERFGHELSKARRQNRLLGLMFVDLDHMKKVNDAHGHAVGDALLIEASMRMRICLRDSDTVARFGGDEFTILAPEINDPADAEQIARKVLDEIEREFVIGDKTMRLSASIGIAFYPQHGNDIDSLIGRADQAIHHAKSGGRNRYHVANQS